MNRWLTREESLKLQRLWREHPEITKTELAQRFGITLGALRRHIRKTERKECCPQNQQTTLRQAC